MILKTIAGGVTLLVVVFLVYLMYLGKVSRTGTSPGLVDGMLKPCQNKPNCVCSEYSQDSIHAIEAIRYNGTSEQALQSMKNIINATGGEIVSSRDNYLAATFTSSLFGFVDDVEFRFDPGKQLIQVRSASRVGHSDLDANRKRVEAIREIFSDN